MTDSEGTGLDFFESHDAHAVAAETFARWMMQRQRQNFRGNVFESGEAHREAFVNFLAATSPEEGLRGARTLERAQMDQARGSDLDERIVSAKAMARIEAAFEVGPAEMRRWHVREHGVAIGDCFPTRSCPR